MECTRSPEKRKPVSCTRNACQIRGQTRHHLATRPLFFWFSRSHGQVANQETDVRRSQHRATPTINGPIISGYIRAAEEHFPCTKVDHIRRSWITGGNLLLRLLRHLLNRRILTVEKSYFPPKQQKDIKAPPSLDLTRRHFRVNHSTERISASTLCFNRQHLCNSID